MTGPRRRARYGDGMARTRSDPVTVLVFTGGEGVPAGLGARLPPAGAVVAADQGVHHARALGIAVDVLVGDLDSVDPAVLAELESAGTTVERHPTDKDATDLELALDRAVALGATRIVVVGGAGGRLDHLLGNALVLAAPKYAEVAVSAHFGAGRLHVVRRELRTTGAVGELVTLLAVGGPARGVTTAGLRWELHAETLLPGSSRGLSNERVADEARVQVEDGVLLVVEPGPA